MTTTANHPNGLILSDEKPGTSKSCACSAKPALLEDDQAACAQYETCLHDVFAAGSDHCLAKIRAYRGPGDTRITNFMTGRLDVCEAEDSLLIKLRSANSTKGARKRKRDRSEPLARKLDFPSLLVDERNRICMPLERAIASAQQGIDEGLTCLSPAERRMYCAATSHVCLELYPSGTMHWITLENGRLRLWDDADVEEMMVRYTKGGELLECMRGQVETPEEVLAFAMVVSTGWDGPDLSMVSVWEELAPLIRSGLVRCADVAATSYVMDRMGYRNRVRECLALRRLMSELGWPVHYAREALIFMVSLHHIAGDADYDAARELIDANAIFEAVMMTVPGAWDAVTGQAEMVGYFSSERYEDLDFPLADQCHGFIDAARRCDKDRASALLAEIYHEIRGYDCDDTSDSKPCLGGSRMEGSFVFPHLAQEVIEEYVRRKAAARGGPCGGVLEDMRNRAAQERFITLGFVQHEIAGLPVGRYPPSAFGDNDAPLDERVAKLEKDCLELLNRAARVKEDLTVMPAMKRELIGLCVEAFDGTRMVNEAIDPQTGLARYTVCVPAGTLELDERHLGVGQLRREKPEFFSSLATPLNVEDWNEINSVLVELWKSRYLTLCRGHVEVMKCSLEQAEKNGEVVTPGLGNDECRTAAFMALVHCILKGDAEWGRGVRIESSGEQSFRWLINTVWDIQKGLDELGMPTPGFLQGIAGALRQAKERA